MIDKLWLTSSISSGWTTERLQARLKGRRLPATPYYRTVEGFSSRLETEGHVLTLYRDPAHYSFSPLKLVLNPSKLKRHGAVEELVSLAIDDPASARISRIDHTVDIAVPVGRLFECIRIKRKKLSKDYKNGTLTGFQLGGSPEVLVVYDKAREQRNLGTLSRIELRQYHQKVPVTTFGELKLLMQFEPFSSLSIADPVEPQLFSSRHDQVKAAYAQESIKKAGGQGFYKQQNTFWNFKRDWGRFFTSPADIPDLNRIYKMQLEEYFKAEPSVVDDPKENGVQV